MKTIERSVVTTSPYAQIIKGGPGFEFPNGEKEGGIACCVSKVDVKHTEEFKREMVTREIEELEKNAYRDRLSHDEKNIGKMHHHLKALHKLVYLDNLEKKKNLNILEKYENENKQIYVFNKLSSIFKLIIK